MSGKYFTITVPIFHHEIIVSKQEKDETLFKRLTKSGQNYYECRQKLCLTKGEHGVTELFPNCTVVIRLERFNDNKELRELVIHEAKHAADYILHNIGMKDVMEISDEAYAYLQEFICGEIFKKLKI